MKIIFITCLLLTVSACAVNHDVAMKLEKTPNDFKIMIGEFDGSLALIHGDPKNAEIHATDGEFSCMGKSNSGKFKTDLRKNIVTHLFKITCDNGATGQMILKITMQGDFYVYGVGIGNMSDDSKLKIIVGDISGVLAW